MISPFNDVATVHQSEGPAASSQGSEVGPRFCPPLQWWRLFSAEAFRPSDIRIIRRAMRLSCGLDDPRWIEAMRGDASSAIGLAVKTFRGADDRTTDLAMSALVCCALEGNPSAVIVIAAALRRRVATDPTAGALETSWYLADFSHCHPRARPKCRRARFPSA